jgi:hypothetical protein
LQWTLEQNASVARSSIDGSLCFACRNSNRKQCGSDRSIDRHVVVKSADDDKDRYCARAFVTSMLRVMSYGQYRRATES